MKDSKIIIAKGKTVHEAYRALAEELDIKQEPGYRLINVQGTQAFEMPKSQMLGQQPVPVFIVTAVLAHDALQEIIDRLQTEDNPFGLAELQAAILEHIPALVYSIRSKTEWLLGQREKREQQESCDHEWKAVDTILSFCNKCKLSWSLNEGQPPAHGTEIEKPPH